jgi:UDP-GlcNAc:undecaprenyl-phosphate/decaprenyl-phosphate GlcNAc-1-phosphate transferase
VKSYFAIFLIAAFSSLMFTPLLRRLCERFGLVDASNDERRVHRTAVPRLGGVAIFLSMALALASLLFVKNVLTQALRGEANHIGIVLLCALLILAIGAFDDLRGLSALIKFVAVVAVTVLFYWLGGSIEGLSIPFVGQVILHPIAGFLLTLIWVVGITNAFNLIDGIDGLASGSALFSSLVLLTVSLLQGQASIAVMALALTGALAGFLRYNFNPASIFLGDSGSLFVGFSLAALSIMGSQKATTAVAVAIPILAFGLPVVDTTVTIGRRLLSGKPVFKGDREHIHHKLLARGWSQRRVALVLYGVSATFGLAAMLFVNSGSGLTAVILFVLGVAVAVALGRLRYHEVDELRASVKRNLGDRRTRAINNLRVRRACDTLSSAQNLNDLFGAIVEVLEAGQFVYAAAQLSCNGHANINERALEIAGADGASHDPAQLIEGRLQWTWQCSNRKAAPVVGSDQFWEMRLPLASSECPIGYLNLYRPFDADPLMFDVNYLTNVFQPAVAEAAVRIFETAEQSMARKMTAAAR